MIRTLTRRGAYRPGAGAWRRLARISLATAAMAGVMAAMAAHRPMMEAVLGSKEVAVAVVIFGGGLFYFGCAFAFRAVSLDEVRAAFRRERGPAAPGLPGSFEG
jgi:peptidoglycan biosynthesis protein MviN/MurJ (putative lipid II flippase)